MILSTLAHGSHSFVSNRLILMGINPSKGLMQSKGVRSTYNLIHFPLYSRCGTPWRHISPPLLGLHKNNCHPPTRSPLSVLPRYKWIYVKTIFRRAGRFQSVLMSGRLRFDIWVGGFKLPRPLKLKKKTLQLHLFFIDFTYLSKHIWLLK